VEIKSQKKTVLKVTLSQADLLEMIRKETRMAGDLEKIKIFVETSAACGGLGPFYSTCLEADGKILVELTLTQEN
jgi:hypothetical protein